MTISNFAQALATVALNHPPHYPNIRNNHLKCLKIEKSRNQKRVRRGLKWINVQLVTTQLTIRNVSLNDSCPTFLKEIEPCNPSTAPVTHRHLVCSTWAVRQPNHRWSAYAYTIKLWIEKLAESNIMTELTDEKCKNCSNLASHEWINFDHSRSSVVDTTMKIYWNPNIL